MKLLPNTWYLDPDTSARFKVLGVRKDTVDVLDERGNRRILNRIICEGSLKTDRPSIRQKGKG